MNEPCFKCGEYHNQCFELKQLTDEEIADCLIEWAKVEHCDEYSDPTAEELAPIIKMIRAILKKAQEK